jgi:hypothetical protein
LTAEEYALLPDVEGFRDELIEGERVLSPMPKAAHTPESDTVSVYRDGDQMSTPFRGAVAEIFATLEEA